MSAKSDFEQLQTTILNKLENSHRTVWTPYMIARDIFGWQAADKKECISRVVRALNRLHEKKHLGKLLAYGSNQSVYWLTSRVVVPANIDDIPF